MLGNAMGSTTRRVVCHLLDPKARLAWRKVSFTAFKASSVVRIITGKTISPSVSDPAIILSPKFNLFTNNAIPNKPKTMDGMPARLLVIWFKNLLIQPSLAYSFM